MVNIVKCMRSDESFLIDNVMSYFFNIPSICGHKLEM